MHLRYNYLVTSVGFGGLGLEGGLGASSRAPRLGRQHVGLVLLVDTRVSGRTAVALNLGHDVSLIRAPRF